MLTVAGAPGHKVDTWLANLLPLCGPALAPSDFATFALYRAQTGGVGFIPVLASRPAVVAALHAPFAGRRLFEAGIKTPGGSLMTVRCRSLISPRYDVAPSTRDPEHEWLARNGLYVAQFQEFSLERLNAAAAKLVELEESFGNNSPRLLPALTDLGAQLSARAVTHRDIDASRIAQLEMRTRTILNAVAGPVDWMPTDKEAALRAALATNENVASARASLRKMFEERVARVPLILAYSNALDWLGGDTDLPTVDKRRIVERLLARFKDTPDDLRRRALLVRLSDIERGDGRLLQTRRALIAAGAGPGTCPLLDEQPKEFANAFDYGDYPDDLVKGGFSGLLAFELDLDVRGRASDIRALLSAPSGLFDEVTVRKLSSTTLAAGTSRGRPAACTAAYSQVRWLLPDEDEDVLPTLEQPNDVPST